MQKIMYVKWLKLTAALLFCCLFISFGTITDAHTLHNTPDSTPGNKKIHSWQDMEREFPGHYFLHGPRNEMKVSLSFDDAPDLRFTPQILDILAEYGVKATFFVVGHRAEKHPELVERIKQEGHEIGNHSYNHSQFSKLTLDQYRNQLLKTNQIIEKIAGYSPRFTRPPYGDLLPEQLSWNSKENFVIVNWDVDSEDWKNDPTSEQIMLNVKRTLRPGSIILQHAGGGTGQSLKGTIEALPELIHTLKKDGYQIVLISELINQSITR